MLKNIFFSASTTVATFILCIVIVWFFSDFSFFKISSFLNKNVSLEFYAERKDITLYINTITGFYNTIIAFLLSLLALVSGLAFIVVRASAADAAELAASDKVPVFLQSKEGKNIISTSVSTDLENRLQRLEDALRTLIVELEDDDERLTQVSNILEGHKNEEAS